MPVETELKLILPDRESMKHVASLAEIVGYAVEDRGLEKHTDVYFDTLDFQLFQRKIILRFRTRAHTSFITFKAQGETSGEIYRRIEIEEKTNKTVDDISRGLLTDTAPLKALYEHTGKVNLSPSLYVENNRHILLLTSEDIPRFELALDEVTFSGPKGMKKVFELEVESLSGEDKDLKKIGQWLAGRFNLRSAGPSKYIQGMKLVGRVK
ncbi:MAG TPA: CYTH domain-containing protein [Anaerolineae bacterium]|nr:CYTH domain-containing protein [Anaerolineae bacterium]